MTFEGIRPELASRVERTFAALEARGVRPAFARDRGGALTTVLEMMPKGASVAHGTSTTLIEIGFVDALKRPDSGYRYLNAEWQAESDPAKRARVRARLPLHSGYYLRNEPAVFENREGLRPGARGGRPAVYTYRPPPPTCASG